MNSHTGCLPGRGRVAAIDVGLDMAVPLGLLLTELVSNILKHAFSERTPGLGSGQRDPAGDGALLTVADNGIGLPPEFEVLAGRSLGLKLASSLARQLDGELQFSGPRGAEFRVRIPFHIPRL